MYKDASRYFIINKPDFKHTFHKHVKLLIAENIHISNTKKSCSAYIVIHLFQTQKHINYTVSKLHNKTEQTLKHTYIIITLKYTS